MSRFARLTSLTATFALLGAMSGCGAGAPGASELTFRSVTGAKTAAKATKASSKTSPARPASQAGQPTAVQVVPVAEAARQAVVASAGAGSLRVAFASLGAPRSLMSLDDVAGVRATLVAANGATQVQHLDRAALAGEHPTLAFAGVAAGQASLTVAVLDAGGALLGEAAATAQVVARQTVDVDLTVRLAATGNLAANVTIVEDAAVVVATPTPAPTAAPTAAPTVLPSPSPSLPSFLTSAAPSATPSLPSFLTSPAPTAVPTAAPSAAIGGTRDVWGRLYDYAGTQIQTGSVRFTSQDASAPFDVAADLRADGYYYVAGVPTGVTVQVQATAGSLGVTSWYVFSHDGQTTYDWLDLFVSDTGTADTSDWGWW